MLVHFASDGTPDLKVIQKICGGYRDEKSKQYSTRQPSHHYRRFRLSDSQRFMIVLPPPPSLHGMLHPRARIGTAVHSKHCTLPPPINLMQLSKRPPHVCQRPLAVSSSSPPRLSAGS